MESFFERVLKGLFNNGGQSFFLNGSMETTEAGAAHRSTQTTLLLFCSTTSAGKIPKQTIWIASDHSGSSSSCRAAMRVYGGI